MTAHTLESLLAERTDQEVRELCGLWSGGAKPPEGRGAQARFLARAMMDEEAVAARVRGLPRILAGLLESHLRLPGHARPLQEALDDRRLGFRSRYELEAALVRLAREGLLLPVRSRQWHRFGQPAHAVPLEVASALAGWRRRREGALPDSLTLAGFLKYRCPNPERRRGRTRTRKVRWLLLRPKAVAWRLARLPASTRSLVESAAAQFGGLLPRDRHRRLHGREEEARFDPRRLRLELEEAALGTVADLDLARFGITSEEQVLVVFQEVATPLLEERVLKVEREGLVEHEAGVDLASNLRRLLRFVERRKVRLTVRDRMFKADTARFLERMILTPGAAVEPVEMLRFLLGFCVARGLLVLVPEEGRVRAATGAREEFEGRDLLSKVRTLLDHAVHERGLPGERFHQARLRKLFMGQLRILRPGEWQHAMSLALLARNDYLMRLDMLAAEEYFAARIHSGVRAHQEDLQGLCWNLLAWVRLRLHPLGIVDLGMHAGKLEALRVTQLGRAILMGRSLAESGAPRSSLLVNPDFEVIVFPEADAAELVHLLDRFCARTKSDRLHHFRITADSVGEAAAEGMGASRMLEVLQARARAPLPQNVLFSLGQWAGRTGSAARAGRGPVL